MTDIKVNLEPKPGRKMYLPGGHEATFIEDRVIVLTFRTQMYFDPSAGDVTHVTFRSMESPEFRAQCETLAAQFVDTRKNPKRGAICHLTSSDGRHCVFDVNDLVALQIL